jgi:hypothetical protein
MAVDDMTSGGMSLFGYIIAFVIIVWVISAITGGNGFGFGSNGRGAYSYETLKEIFEGQKANISQTATTQYMIENQANQTRDYLGTKIDFYEYQNLRDKVNERDMVIAELKNQLFVKDQLTPINEKLATIGCNMLRKPEVTGIGVACPSAAILNGLGVNHLNQCGNCNNGNLL